MIIIEKPNSSDLNDYYKSYLHLIPEQDMLSVLEEQKFSSQAFFETISETDSKLIYQEGKWSIKQVVGHLCDTERILAYRALCFARNDQTAIPGFDENLYVDNANFSGRSWPSICDEKFIISQASYSLFKSLDPEAYRNQGLANGSRQSARSILFFIIAHERHHLQVIKERYLKL